TTRSTCPSAWPRPSRASTTSASARAPTTTRARPPSPRSASPTSPAMPRALNRRANRAPPALAGPRGRYRWLPSGRGRPGDQPHGLVGAHDAPHAREHAVHEEVLRPGPLAVAAVADEDQVVAQVARA